MVIGVSFNQEEDLYYGKFIHYSSFCYWMWLNKIFERSMQLFDFLFYFELSILVTGGEVIWLEPSFHRGIVGNALYRRNQSRCGSTGAHSDCAYFFCCFMLVLHMRSFMCSYKLDANKFQILNYGHLFIRNLYGLGSSLFIVCIL